MKFGGTSVGSATRIAATTDIVTATRKPVVVVLSAMSGVTNMLIDGKLNEALDRYMQAAEELGVASDFRKAAGKIVAAAHTADEIVACGEQLSAALAVMYMRSRGMDAVRLPALDFMALEAAGRPDTAAIASKLSAAMDHAGSHDVYVVEGFICRDSQGRITTLSRGGSDFTATLLGEALHAGQVQIWTDVDGVYTADPRYVAGARRIPRMSYEQASLAARCGAKILHPDCVQPVQRAGVSLRVLDSFHPDAPGTEIGPDAAESADGYFAVAAVGDTVYLVGREAEAHNAEPGHAHELMQTLHDKYISK